MRMIDADAFLMDSIKEKQFFIYKEDALNDIFVVNTVYGDLKKALANTPTIDAVEVVRCKDCIKHYDSKFGYVVCLWFNKTVRADGYCSYGERKMDAEVEG
jgi:hypothetical protein